MFMECDREFRKTEKDVILNFREIFFALIGISSNRYATCNSHLSKPSIFSEFSHQFPIKTKRKRCRVCSRNNKKKFSYISCFTYKR